MSKLSKIDNEKFAAAWARLDIPLDRMAAALDCSRQALSFRAKRDGLPLRKGNQVPNKLLSDEAFTRMWLAGVSAADMARLGGYAHPSCIGKRRVLLGLPPRRRAGGGLGGWTGTITLAEFHEIELARMMQQGNVRARLPAPTCARQQHAKLPRCDRRETMGNHYSGDSRDILTLIEVLAKKMAESDLTGAEVCLPFSEGDLVIRMKRQPR